MAEDSQAAACQKAALQSSSADETETVQGRCKPRTIVHLNPRRLPLPRADDLPVGSGQGSFLGVAYRGDRPSSPWIARLDGHNLGTYRSAYEAALARWVCMHYDRDIVERNGVWYGVAYDHSEGRLVLLTRFTDATEDAVLARIDHHFCLDSSHSEEKATTAKTIGCELSTQEQHELPNTSPTLACVQIPAPTNVCANWSALPAVTDTPLSPPNPRREPLPTQLSTTAGRGQYRGVSMQGNQYVARWKKHHIRSYATAFEAGLAWYIAEHFDRDIESDGAFGYVGRAYQRSVDGGGEVQRFRAVTEGEVIRLIDQFHGIVRTGDACCVEQPVSLDAAIRQYWDWMWETRSERDGLAVCDEMYRAWHSFLVYRPELSHLVRIKCKQWQAAVEACLGLVCVQARYQREEQAMSCEPDARPTSTSSHALKLQWRMVMTATCSVAVCEAAWVRRRTVSVRRSIYRQQAVIQDEMRGRSQLKERFPLWIDHWTPPPLLTEEKLDSAAREQAEAMSDSELDDMARNEPENLAAEKELARRRRLQRINDTTYFGHRSSSFVIVPMSTNPEHRPGVKAKSETERQTRKREKDARAQQRARERNKSKGLRAAVHDANLNGPPTPHIVRQAQSALTTQEQMIPQKEQELAQATAERKRAAADLTLARLQVRIDETTDQVDELKQETELVLGGDDEGLSSTLLGASLDAVVPPYDGGRPQNSDTLDVVMLPASGQKARHAHFSLGS